jgi:hypothetical protein
VYDVWVDDMINDPIYGSPDPYFKRISTESAVYVVINVMVNKDGVEVGKSNVE